MVSSPITRLVETASPALAVDEMVSCDVLQAIFEGLFVFHQFIPGATLCNAAIQHILQGHFRPALACLELAKQSKEPVEEYKLIHTTAFCFFATGNQQALSLYKEALQLCSTLCIKHSVSLQVTVAVLSEPEEAKNLLRTALEKEPHHVAALYHLGRIQVLQQDPQAASTLRKALALWEEEQLAGAAGKACILRYLAVAVQDDLHQSLHYYQGCLKVQQGSTRVAVLHEMSSLLLMHNGLEYAIPVLEQALQQAALTGYMNLRTCKVLARLAFVMQQCGRHDRALELWNECYQVQQAVAPGSLDLLQALSHIAALRRFFGDLDTSFNLYTKVYDRTVAISGRNSLAAAYALRNIAQVHHQKQEVAKALTLYQDTLRIQRDHHDGPTELAITLHCIGLVLYYQNMFQLAKECFVDALEKRPADTRERGILCYNLATIYLEMGNDDMAVQYYQETLRIEQHLLGDNHVDVALALQHLGLVHRQRGYLDHALDCFQKALCIELRQSQLSLPNIAKLYNVMGNIHLQRAEVEEMMHAYAQSVRFGHTERDFIISGYNFYGLSKLHPPCAGAA